MNSKKLSLIIPDIRSVYNVGSIFRTADGSGVVKEIILCGYSPTPVDRFGRQRKDFEKTALGAQDSIPWSYHETLYSFLETIKSEESIICAIEQFDNSESLYSQAFEKVISSDKEIYLIVGNEVVGVEKEILQLCDHVFEIPMQGIKESLNVSIATAIALYHAHYILKNN